MHENLVAEVIALSQPVGVAARSRGQRPRLQLRRRFRFLPLRAVVHGLGDLASFGFGAFLQGGFA
jgi:hypothetical protein